MLSKKILCSTWYSYSLTCTGKWIAVSRGIIPGHAELRCHTHFWLPANQIIWSRFLIQIHKFYGKQCRICTVCKGRVYPGSAGLGLISAHAVNIDLYLKGQSDRSIWSAYTYIGSMFIEYLSYWAGMYVNSLLQCFLNEMNLEVLTLCFVLLTKFTVGICSESRFSYGTMPASVALLDAPSDWRPGGRGFTPAEVGNILSWRLIMKYFLWSFSPFRWFKKGSCQFLAKECAQYLLTT